MEQHDLFPMKAYNCKWTEMLCQGMEAGCPDGLLPVAILHLASPAKDTGVLRGGEVVRVCRGVPGWDCLPIENLKVEHAAYEEKWKMLVWKSPQNLSL